jgi:hypothetical protein
MVGDGEQDDTMHRFSKAGSMAIWAVSVIACTSPDSRPTAAAQDAAVPTQEEAPPENPEVMCTLIGCGSGAGLETKVDASLKVLRSSTLTFCRNDSCHTLALKGLPEQYEPDGGLMPQSVQSPSYEERAEGQPVLFASIRPHPEGGIKLAASYHAWSNAGLKDGDSYSVTVQTPEGRKLVEVRRAVTYRVSQPNGPRCPPKCLNATLQ